MLEDSQLLTIRHVLTIAIVLTLPGIAVAQQATYTLKPTPNAAAWGYYDAKVAPVLRVKPEVTNS
jgi:hypothetical protein